MADIKRLLALHTAEAGATRGRKYDVEVLNKSGVVLALACWEAFVEDCATAAFDFVRDNAASGTSVAEPVRRFVANRVREDKNELAPWAMSDQGWKLVLGQYRDAVLKKYVSPLNTPSAENVDALFFELVGIPRVSDAWQRVKMNPAAARGRLKAVIKLRGAIAHRTKATRAVRKDDVREAAELVDTLASITSNQVRAHVFGLVGKYPWQAQPDPPRAGRKPGVVATAGAPTG